MSWGPLVSQWGQTDTYTQRHESKTPLAAPDQCPPPRLHGFSINRLRHTGPFGSWLGPSGVSKIRVRFVPDSVGGCYSSLSLVTTRWHTYSCHYKPEVWCLRMLALQARCPCDLWSSLQWLALPTQKFTQNREPFTLEYCQEQRLIRRQERLRWPGAGQTSVLTTNLVMCNWPLLSHFPPFFLPTGFYPSLFLLLALPPNTL